MKDAPSSGAESSSSSAPIYLLSICYNILWPLASSSRALWWRLCALWSGCHHTASILISAGHWLVEPRHTCAARTASSTSSTSPQHHIINIYMDFITSGQIESKEASEWEYVQFNDPLPPSAGTEPLVTGQLQLCWPVGPGGALLKLSC